MPSRRWEKQGLLGSVARHWEALLDAPGTESTLSQEMERRTGHRCLGRALPVGMRSCYSSIHPSSSAILPASFYLVATKIQTQKSCSEKNPKYTKKKKKRSPPSQVHNESCKTSSAWKILLVSFSYCLIRAWSYTEWVNTFYKVLIHT